MNIYINSEVHLLTKCKLNTKPLTLIKITSDFREKHSGIPKSLAERKADVTFSNLTAGDYIINDQIIIERKTAEDFIQSIFDNRLFEQCSKLKKEQQRVLILLEGNPYETRHEINTLAVKGAILSILTAWQIPMIITQNKENSIELIMMLGRQSLNENKFIKAFKGIKAKKKSSQKLRFLQGIPSTGPVISERLINNFGSIKSIVNAGTDELKKIKGIGKKNANRIFDFFNSQI